MWQMDMSQETNRESKRTSQHKKNAEKQIQKHCLTAKRNARFSYGEHDSFFSLFIFLYYLLFFISNGKNPFAGGNHAQRDSQR